MKMEQTECSETSAYKIQTPENRPEENIQYLEHGENLKSRKFNSFHCLMFPGPCIFIYSNKQTNRCNL
jgi:hypothetical protein